MTPSMKFALPPKKLTAMTVTLVLVAGCAGPSMIGLGGVNYTDRAASRVELGGLGLQAGDGAGYHHLASAAECAIDVPVSIDVIVETFPAAIQSFTPPKLKAIAQRYARTKKSLQESALIGVSIRESDLEKWFASAASEHCDTLIQRNLEAIRFISSVILIVQHPNIQNSTHERIELKVQLGEHGEVHFKAPETEKTLFIANATDVIAYRSAHLCWSEPNGETLSIRVDDARFNACPLGFSESAPEGWQRGGVVSTATAEETTGGQ